METILNKVTHSTPISLENFLSNWQNEYDHSLSHLALFDAEKTGCWSAEQRQYFVKVFYHIRGHFHDVLWHMGNFAPNKEMKNLILDNIKDEFNGDGLSHENLYLLFAKSVGVDLTDELINEVTYLPFVKEFNQGHLKWMRGHSWEERLAFFAALEKLDNVDYVKGKSIAESLGVKKKDLVFFNVHIHVEHFSPIIQHLEKIWIIAPSKIENAFEFIKQHHTKMWNNLSNTIFNYPGNDEPYMEKTNFAGKNAKSLIDHRVENFGAQCTAFGLFGTINYPLYYLIWSYGAKQSYESLFLRTAATIISAPLLFTSYWRHKWKTWLPLYWYSTLTFCLPFFFTFMLFKNNAANVWLMSTSTIFFWLVLLVDWVSYLLILVVGISLAVIAYYFTTPHPFYGISYIAYIPQYLGEIIVVTLFAYNKEILDRIKLQGVRTIGTSIAHELRTPLTSIEWGIGGAEEYLPILIDGYNKAKENGLNVSYISPLHYETLLSLLDDLKKEAQYSNIIIDMLLMNSKDSIILNKNFKLCSINSCVNDALRRYPFKENEKSLITWNNKNEFSFKGDPILMTHLLFNLIKNALYFIESERKGNITIWYEIKRNNNVLCFKDSARGIEKKHLSRIFEAFYSTKLNGAGLGLAYCRAVMLAFGGDIKCFSQHGRFTQFNLYFPIASE